MTNAKFNKTVSYAKWFDFEFRSPTFSDGHFVDNEYDLVRWSEDKTYCWSIGRLSYDEEEYEFSFKSVGLRYLEDREDGLEDFILEFSDRIYKEKTGNEY